MKLLFAAMQLSLGGAETHIFELAVALTRRGHQVTIVSAGGALEKDLRRAGVRCIHAPLGGREPANLLCAALILQALIQPDRFDLIHAHARIPAFLCAPIARRVGIPMVTTAHGIYRITPLLRRLTAWGDGTLAVSCSIKEMLLRAYGLPEPSVSLTVNGIDTDRFSPDPTDKNTSRTHRLVHVSRLSPDSDAAAAALIRIAPRLRAAFPDFTLTVAGDGTSLAALKRQAADLPYIRFLGARTDIPDLLRQADAFVGVSRAALEAMATGLPTVLSGNRGQLGLFRPQIARAARMSNFCGGAKDFSDDALFASVCRALSLSPDERRDMAEYNRQTVLKEYSVKHMADDAEAMYRKVLPRAQRSGQIVIDGYYGYGNCGDETLLCGMLSTLRARMPGKRITVLSANPRDTRLRHGTFSLHRYDPAVLTELMQADLFLLGGGSLFTDRTSRRSLCYYVGMLLLAKAFRCKTWLYAAGIGPLQSKGAKRSVQRALRHADGILLRDKTSLAYAKALLPSCAPRLTCDPALLAPSPDPLWRGYLLHSLKIKAGECFAVSIRPLSDAGDDYEDRLISLIRALCVRTEKTPIYLVMHDAVDRALTERVAKKTGGRVFTPRSGSEAEAVLSVCAFSIPIRLHAAILSHKVGTKLFCLSYDPKTEAFCMEHWLPFCRVEEASAALAEGIAGEVM